MHNMQGQPILILREGTSRTSGMDAKRQNIFAARIVADSVKSTLGPKGMDKMLVDSLGDIVITNDGVTILKEMDVEHPAAKMIIEVAKTQDNEVGDGTTTAVILTGELLKRAEELLDQNIHPTIITRGYRLASEKALEVVESMSKDVNVEDEDILNKVAASAITGKHSEYAVDKLSNVVVKAVKRVAEKKDSGYEVDDDNIKLEKVHGGGIEETELIEGVIINKNVVHASMPKKVKDAKIALLKSALEVKKTSKDGKIKITDPEMLQKFIDQEESMIKELVDAIVNTGANVVICQKGIEDIAQYYLAKAGVLAVRRVKQSDIEKLSKATGANIITDIKEITSDDLGGAALVEEKKFGDDEMVLVRECKNPKAVTILARGGTEHVVDEVERSLNDAVKVVKTAIESGKVVVGGGSPEIEASLKVRQWVPSLEGREQLAAEAFADALESIPRSLAENAGMSPIDILVDLKRAHEEGKVNFGIDVNDNKVDDVESKGILEPLRVKKQAISGATEAATMILRIDDVIASKKGAMPGSGGAPGMGGCGMPPDMGGMC